MFSTHFFNCQKVKNKFKDLDNKVSRAIKKYVDNLDNLNKNELINGLIILKIFFKRYVKLLDDIINKNINGKNSKIKSNNNEKKNKIENNNINISTNNFFQRQINLKEEITVTFRFLPGPQEKVKAKSGEIFYNVFNRFHLEQCPPYLKHYLCWDYHNGKLIDNNKTLFENGVKNGDSVLFIKIDENYKEDKKEDIEEENEEDKEEKEKLIELWIEEYERLMRNNFLFTNEENKSGVNEYLNKKFIEIGIKVKEDEHKLIYCKTNFNWICNECNNEKPKAEPRLFCSICNYNMCNYCRKRKKYYKIGNIPLSASPSNNQINILFIYHFGHEHRLVYCMTKRSPKHSGWICNKCREKFNPKIWTFYCTNCDYDLCYNCAQN